MTATMSEEDTGRRQQHVSFAPHEELHPLQQEKLLSFSHSCSFPKPVRRFVFWTPPKQRQRWGDEDALPHINWGDLFFDLFYVAAAYNLSYVLYYSLSAKGFVYFVGLFCPILLEWFQRTSFDARFVWGDEPWHRFFEIMHLCALSLAVVHIRPVSIMSNPQYQDMFGFSLGVMILAIMNIYRSIEIIVAVDGEKAAIQGEKKWVIGFLTQLAFYLAATVKAGMAYYRGASADEYDHGHRGLESVAHACSRLLNLAPGRDLAADTVQDHTPIILCICGGVGSIITLLITTFFFEEKNGGHKEHNVPMNIEYSIHRFGELVMLLLGESILSILIVPTSSSLAYRLSFYSGIISIVLLQYCHYKYQPHSPSRHAFRRSVRGGTMYYVILIIYCHALVAVGTAYKMFLTQYAYEDSFNNKKLRHLVTTLMSRNLSGAGDEIKYDAKHKKAVANLFCISMAVLWVCLEAMWVAHSGRGKYLAFVRSKQGLFCGILRASIVILMGTISQYTIVPEQVALIGLALICADMAVIIVSDYFWSKRFEIPDDNSHWPNVTEPASVPKECEDKNEDRA